MRDREAINRFCAFSLLGWEAYRGDMDVFLASALKHMDQMSRASRSALRRRLDLSMRANRELFGEHAFRKSLAAGDPHVRRNILNIALFDVCSVTISKIGQEVIDDPAEEARVRRAIIGLVLDDDFSIAITYSTNSTKAVANRFEMAEEALGLS
jgi:hypothetical protein